jgi:hypothetical protein
LKQILLFPCKRRGAALMRAQCQPWPPTRHSPTNKVIKTSSKSTLRKARMGSKIQQVMEAFL